MLNIFFIFIGAGLGGVMRYWVTSAGYVLLGRQFPYGTLLVNVSGCFLMGLVFVLLMERFDGMAPALRALLLIGFLGGYTTFSSFSIETLNLIESGAPLTAFINILLSVILCLAATWIGVTVGRQHEQVISLETKAND